MTEGEIADLRSVLDHDDLSWKAKGLYAFLATKPAGWSPSRARLLLAAADGHRALDTGLKELKQAGLLEIKSESRRGVRGLLWRWKVRTRPS